MDRKRCVVCGEAFEARVDAKTCSNACRQARHRNRPKPWMIVVHEPEPEHAHGPQTGEDSRIVS
jgi:hypothetical protein